MRILSAKIKIDDASIEHLVPKDHNIEISTSYFNLVAVCNKNQIQDSGKFHCDRERGNKLIPLIILYKNAQSDSDGINYYFKSYADGKISSRPDLPSELREQVDSFIKILNLNHSLLTAKRAKDILNGLFDAYKVFLRPVIKRKLIGKFSIREF